MKLSNTSGQDLTRQLLLQENARGLVEDICSTCNDDDEQASLQQGTQTYASKENLMSTRNQHG